MEHVATHGYIAKLWRWAAFQFIAAPPKEEMLDILNPKAFVFWDVDHLEKALEWIWYLEENQTTYDEQVLQQPILAWGAVKKKGFLLDDNVGGGILKAQINLSSGTRSL
jgi:hypothetical protein